MKKFISIFHILITFLSSAQVVQFYDDKSKENVNYTVTTINAVGMPVKDSDVDGIFFSKKGSTYYKRVTPDNRINVLWYGNNSDAINKAIKASIHYFGTQAIQIAEVYMPAAIYDIDKTIEIKSVKGFKLTGAGTSTTLRLRNGVNINDMILFNGVAYGYLGNFEVVGETGRVKNVIRSVWGDGISNPPAGSLRSSTKNKFENIHIHGETKFDTGVFLDGSNQNDETELINITIAGNINDADKTLYNNAFKIGNGTFGNNLSHTFIDCQANQVRNAFYFNNVGGVVIGRGAQNCNTYILRTGSNETLSVDGVRLEGIGMIYNHNSIHYAGDNITLKNIWYSGLGRGLRGAPADGNIITHTGGTMNIIGCRFLDPLPGTNFKITSANSARGSNLQITSNLNIFGLNFQGSYRGVEDLINAGAPTSVNAIGILVLNKERSGIDSFPPFYKKYAVKP
ncbi:hypothetical protein [Halpernia frigidisoli]|uniref:Uncharacterized protein n=1 Tax=Halpernia frigidisoli TaxID=1125876 RepID=A0A1I3DT52_9FLAO|nr:hypothetical protein [Halpernia frigidisoli]SFH89920.1 hypothetical protein SAMN05443292_0693 [Halpernia frigidisoli]